MRRLWPRMGGKNTMKKDNSLFDEGFERSNRRAVRRAFGYLSWRVNKFYWAWYISIYFVIVLCMGMYFYSFNNRVAYSFVVVGALFSIFMCCHFYYKWQTTNKKVR